MVILKKKYSMENSYHNWLLHQKSYKVELAVKTNLPADYFYGNGYQVVPTISKNTKYWIEWPEVLSSSSMSLVKYLRANGERYYKVDPSLYFKYLPVNKQIEFVTAVGLDKKWANGEGGGTLNNQTIGEALEASPKPNIVITGTAPEDVMNASILEVKEFYGDGYDYFSRVIRTSLFIHPILV